MLHVEGNEEVVVIDIDPVGKITAIYDDELFDTFKALGTLRRPRASEIDEDPATGLFIPDLRLSGGPILPGCALKRDAERVEVDWLTKHRVGYPFGG